MTPERGVVDIVLTDYEHRHQSQADRFDRGVQSFGLPHCTIGGCETSPYSIVWQAPDRSSLRTGLWGIIENRDGTILDVVREIKPYEFED